MNVEITANPEHQGIEVKFDGKPSDEVRHKLKQFAFRWHRVKKLWYGSDTKSSRMMLEAEFGVKTDAILGALDEEANAPEPSLDNIERRKYFLIDFLYSDLEGLPALATYLLFHRDHIEAEKIAWKYGNNILGDTIRNVSWTQGRKLTLAKTLFEQGKMIHFDPETGELIQPSHIAPPIPVSRPDSDTPIGSEQTPEQEESIATYEHDKTVPESTTEDERSINAQIEILLDLKQNTGAILSQAERNLFLQYQPDGGKAVQGVEGSGILYEYFTPDEVVRKMWGMAFEYGFKPGGKVLEPSCGIGGFLPYVHPSSEVTCYETNAVSSGIAQLLYPFAEVINEPFESRFFSGTIAHKGDFGKPEFDLVIGNPPYGKFQSRHAGMGEKKYTKASRYEEYFIIRGLDLLRSGGLLIYIIPSGFLSGPISPAKKEIDKRARVLVDAYRLPVGMFPTTSIGTDIIVLKKK